MVKRIALTLAVVILILVIALVGYVIYFLSEYYRVEDMQELNISDGDSKKMKLEAGEDKIYSITSYNIGFGAYSADYDFFMDGGTHARAFSREAAEKNTTGCIAEIEAKNPDFMLFQEVDTDSTRSYHVNQYEQMQKTFAECDSVFAQNFDTPYMLYPFREPIGKSVSGIATLSKYSISNAVRRSLPIDKGLSKFIDLDRCYSYSEVKVDEERSLYIFNVHLSAYSKEADTVINQVKMLADDLKALYEQGHYVIVGGDFNQDLLENSMEVFGVDSSQYSWAQKFRKDLLPEGFGIVPVSEPYSAVPTTRYADKPYKKGESVVLAIDGFVVSDNIEVVSLENVDTEFLYSDHNPVFMKFKLLQE